MGFASPSPFAGDAYNHQYHIPHLICEQIRLHKPADVFAWVGITNPPHQKGAHLRVANRRALTQHHATSPMSPPHRPNQKPKTNGTRRGRKGPRTRAPDQVQPCVHLLVHLSTIQHCQHNNSEVRTRAGTRDHRRAAHFWCRWRGRCGHRRRLLHSLHALLCIPARSCPPKRFTGTRRHEQPARLGRIRHAWTVPKPRAGRHKHRHCWEWWREVA